MIAAADTAGAAKMVSELNQKEDAAIASELAAKTLAKSAVEIFSNPSIIIDSKNELKSRVGNDFQYKPLLGDREQCYGTCQSKLRGQHEISCSFNGKR